MLGDERYPDNTTISNNIANRDMVINYEPSAAQAGKVAEIVLDKGTNTGRGGLRPETGAERVQR